MNKKDIQEIKKKHGENIVPSIVYDASNSKDAMGNLKKGWELYFFALNRTIKPSVHNGKKFHYTLGYFVAKSKSGGFHFIKNATVSDILLSEFKELSYNDSKELIAKVIR